MFLFEEKTPLKLIINKKIKIFKLDMLIFSFQQKGSLSEHGLTINWCCQLFWCQKWAKS